MDYRSPLSDPNVIDALQDGRSVRDIALIECPRCGNLGFYNEGSHFTCSVEGCNFSAFGDVLDELADDSLMTLEDWQSAQEPNDYGVLEEYGLIDEEDG